MSFDSSTVMIIFKGRDGVDGWWWEVVGGASAAERCCPD